MLLKETRMPISIAGKKLIVTGGARGLGSDTVRYFAKEGADVTSFDVLDDPGRKVAEEATTRGPGTVSFRHVDVTNEADVRSGIASAVQALRGLRGVIKIAGITT